MNLSTGFLKLGRVRGIPIKIHWTAPLGALIFSGASFRPGAWLGFLLLILLHELGHAALIRYYRLHVLEVHLHGFGGECVWAGGATEKQHAVIAWGGVLAQAALLLLVAPLTFLPGLTSMFWRDLISAWTASNLMLIGFNLLPIPPLDGSRAWKLLPMLWKGRSKPPAPPARKAAPHLRLVHDAKRPKGDVSLSRHQVEPDDDKLPPMPDEIRRELDRITREAARAARNKDQN